MHYLKNGINSLLLLLTININSQVDFVSDGFPMEDMTQFLSPVMSGGISVGNSCGTGTLISNVYGNLEFGGETVQMLDSQITVYGELTNYGEIIDISEILSLGLLRFDCDQATVVITSETLNAATPTLEQVLVYPNPATDYFYVKGSNLKKIVLYDIRGRIVVDIRKPKLYTKVSLLGYKSGIYLVRIFGNNNSVESKKLIIK